MARTRTTLRLVPVLVLALGALPLDGAEPAPPAAQHAAAVVVRLATSLGDIDIEVDLARAPATAANFLRYVEAGRYDGGRFHRTVRADTEVRKDVPIEVVQAGVDPGWPRG